MNFVAYNYFKPNSRDHIDGIRQALGSSELELTHLGKSDPPKKWSGSVPEATEIIWKGSDMTNYTFARDTKNQIELDFALGNSTEAIVSSISVNGPDRKLVEDICLNFARQLDSFLCISGELGLGPQQSWSYLMQSKNCPPAILRQVENA